MPMNNGIKLINTSKLQMLRLTIKCRETPMTMRIGDNVEYGASHSNCVIGKYGNRRFVLAGMNLPRKCGGDLMRSTWT